MVGHSLDQPLVLLEWAPFFISFVFSALTLLFFILKHRAYLVFASIAGMGGYLSHVVISVVLDNEMSKSEYRYGLIYFGLPMILVFLYDGVKAYVDAGNLRRITPAERIRRAQKKPEWRSSARFWPNPAVQAD